MKKKITGPVEVRSSDFFQCYLESYFSPLFKPQYCDMICLLAYVQLPPPLDFFFWWKVVAVHGLIKPVCEYISALHDKVKFYRQLAPI